MFVRINGQQLFRNSGLVVKDLATSNQEMATLESPTALCVHQNNLIMVCISCSSVVVSPLSVLLLGLPPSKIHVL